MSAVCLRAVQACGSDLRSRYERLGAPQSSRRLALDDFERWRPRVVVWLRIAAAFLLLYWIAWFADRNVVASSHAAQYVAFEQSFPLADTWLAGVALMAAVALRARRPSALIWLAAVGGAALYLGALDVLYDIENGIYAKGGGGFIELAINLITVLSGVGVLRFCWRFHRRLLAGSNQP